MRLAVVLVLSVAGLAACKKEEAKPLPSPFGSGSQARPKPEQVTPPFDLKNPPADVTTTASGLKYKKIIANETGIAPSRNDTVLVTYTGWKQSTGDTFFTNHTGKPMPLPLATAAPGFTEAMQLLKKGEKAMLWVPPAIGYMGPPSAKAETLVYEVEIIDVIPAPSIPADVAAPPATAQKLKSGLPYVIVRPGTGTDKARYFDTVTYNYTAWDTNGRMFDSTEMKKKPNTLEPFHASKPIEDVLGVMTAGERARLWVPAEAMFAGGNRVVPGMPKGQLCYEVEVLQISKKPEPPPVPADVAKPPADAKKSPKGVFYHVLKAGAGPHPAPTDKVKVNYTGWNTEGRMFDTSTTKGQPVEFGLNGVIAGWTDALQLMSVGDKFRMWIPEELAYKGAPNKPQGMLVFEIEMLEIEAP
jgi:FKBP-type peptidyl-prolyl cis-trans isomerase